jgi:hypothetical protein
MYVLYYASILQCWQLIWILVKTNHPSLRVGRHTFIGLRSTRSTESKGLRILWGCFSTLDGF